MMVIIIVKSQSALWKFSAGVEDCIDFKKFYILSFEKKKNKLLNLSCVLTLRVSLSQNVLWTDLLLHLCASKK